MLDLVFYYIGYSQLQQYTIIEQIWIPLVRSSSWVIQTVALSTCLLWECVSQHLGKPVPKRKTNILTCIDTQVGLGQQLEVGVK
jgi:hypothetical protein